MRQYVYNVFLAMSQFLNSLLLGDPDESISGRLGRAYLSGRPKWWVTPWMTFVDWMFVMLFGEIQHCIKSVEYGEEHAKELWSWIEP